MSIDISNVSLPATVTSGFSSVPKSCYRQKEETFSVKYSGQLPNKFLLELAACYLVCEDRSVTTINGVNNAFGALCEYSLDRNVHSLSDVVNSQTIPIFFDYMKRVYTKSWKT